MTSSIIFNTPFFKRLRSLNYFNKDDFDFLETFFKTRQSIDKGTFLQYENTPLSEVSIIISGWAARTKYLEDGQRQIVNFIIPGDMVDIFSLLFSKTEYGAEAITPMTLVTFSAKEIITILEHSAHLALAISWLAGQDERILEQHIVQNSRRKATHRMAHLFIELYHRLCSAGYSLEEARYLPLTQALLADALGMSTIHVHRTFHLLVLERLVSLEQHKIVLLDVSTLSTLAGFDVNYNHPSNLPLRLLKNSHQANQ